ncbi:hypothetical protein CAPGI0001_2403 [Capnocytophaga gingivalis ATCC 33624]|uniref:DUF6493 family protein n=1 Tax=Capnocytophaga gingivalis TaxID=1017 RepID=UPI00019FBA2F|nr:DUF6493 family protein [Capnocytophaga gingivalis]EEK13343.1 hypothetical protein CAPGI0001_2403 [Capnocytophaga gingivalis ATCC 33624]
MKENLLSAIKAHDFTAIRNICFALSEEERNDLIHTLQTARWEQLYHNTDKRAPRLQSLDIVCFSYIFLCVSRSSESLKKAVKGCYSSDKDIVAEFLQFYFPHLLDLLTTQEGQYLITTLQSLRKNHFLQDTTFQNLWTLYQKGFIAFDEDLFIEKFFFWNNKHITDEPFVDFLLENKQISEKIFAIVPQHITQEVPYPSEAWKELYSILQAKGYFADRSIVGSHIEALLNPYKKNILDFFCRIIETFEPTRQELLSHQSTLFALLSSDKTSVVNFVMKLIKEIASEKGFDFQSFADNFALCFATQKIAKSQLIGLDILAKHYKKQPPTHIESREQLAVLFTVPDVKLQEKVASLLTTYFGGEGLAEVVAPYQDYLKGKAQELLQSLPSPNSSETSETACAARTPKIAPAARTPHTWDDLLFLIGDCIRERSPLALDLFFEGLNQLQAQIPADFSRQISPYQKQLGEQPFEFTTYRKCMRWVIDVWEGKASLSDDIFGGKLYNPTPFLREKTKRLLLKLKQGNSLPFVSTPTHAPFYIDPLTFLERIAQYEKTEKSPMLEDVVVGLNRLLPTEVTEEQKQLARSLTGNYAPALQYYFEVNKQIAVTDATRVLWGQVLRLKDLDGVFPELEIPQKTNLQGLAHPFYLKYEVKPTKIKGVELNKIILEDNWDKKYSAYSLYNDLGANYYNVSPMSRATDEDIDYGLSLNPRYIDGWLCKYLLTYAQGVEGESLTEATRVMSLLLEHHLPIYHGGWLMVATCLLAERKPLRDLATEYILLALQRGETLTYLAEAIGTLLAHKYAPIARFVEFLDLPTRDPKVKAFQKSVVEAYLPLAEKLEKKPTNHKKLAAFSD